MGRSFGSKNIALKWVVRIELGDNTIFHEHFCNLKEVAQKLDLTYTQVYEITDMGRRKNKNKINNSGYLTNLFIEKM